MRILTSLAPLVLLAGCVTEMTEDGGRPADEDTDWRAGGKGDGETCEFDAMPAAKYYDQFAYAKVEHEGSTSTWYRVGLTWDLKARLDNGNAVDLNVYFLAENRVIVEYQEEVGLGGGQSQIENETVVVTHATIDAATRTISIAGLGTGTPITVRQNGRCAPGITFQLAEDIRSAGLAGDTTVVQAGLSSAYVIDPDHLDQVPNATARKWFEEDVASGKIVVIRK